MSEQKIWCGKGKEFGPYNKIKLNICLDKIPTEYISEYQGKRYLKLVLSKTRVADEKGNTHGVEVDTWKPDPGYKKKNYGDTPAQLAEQLDPPF